MTGTEGAQKTPRGAEDAASARTSSGERPATTPPEAHDTEPPAGPTPSFRARQHTLIGVPANVGDDVGIFGMEEIDRAAAERFELLAQRDHPAHPPQQRMVIALLRFNVDGLVVILVIDNDGQDELLRIWQEQQNSVLFVTHNIEEAVYLSDTVHVMSASPGTIVESIEVDLPRPRTGAMRVMPEFLRLRRRLREVLVR